MILKLATHTCLKLKCHHCYLAQISVSHLNGKNLSLIKLAEQMLFASKLNLMYLSLNYYQEIFLFISVDDLLKKVQYVSKFQLESIYGKQVS